MFDIDGVLKLGLGIIDKFVPDKQKQAEFEAEYRKALLDADNQQSLAQSDINKVEAANEHIFVSGWRPFIGWVCGAALAYHFILQPLIAFIASATGHPITLPVFDMNTLYTVLMGMLGLGTMRTFEKIKK